MAQCNMTPQMENTVAYCQSWSKKLKEAPAGLIVQAASQADKAVAYILGREREQDKKLSNEAEKCLAR